MRRKGAINKSVKLLRAYNRCIKPYDDYGIQPLYSSYSSTYDMLESFVHNLVMEHMTCEQLRRMNIPAPKICIDPINFKGYNTSDWEGMYEAFCEQDYNLDDAFLFFQNYGWNLVTLGEHFEECCEDDSISRESVKKIIADYVGSGVENIENAVNIVQSVMTDEKGLSIYFLFNDKVGTFMKYAEQHTCVKNTNLYKGIADLAKKVALPLHYFFSEWCVAECSTTEELYYGIFCIGYSEGWDCEMSLYNTFDFGSYFSAYFLDKLLDVAEDVYCFSSCKEVDQCAS